MLHFEGGGGGAAAASDGCFVFECFYVWVIFAQKSDTRKSLLRKGLKIMLLFFELVARFMRCLK
ncbi:MAG: hypothetical protein JSS86_17815 [Cyanobacteria bacterium SZAS LIN-2]|nr:hypothetical protein [Cyanobacteria bacterium SZAS LIN-3]MBS1998188.1 hypothetical protein [Cyanobacteria bacterium SZAS LIN-2]